MHIIKVGILIDHPTRNATTAEFRGEQQSRGSGPHDKYGYIDHQSTIRKVLVKSSMIVATGQ